MTIGRREILMLLAGLTRGCLQASEPVKGDKVYFTGRVAEIAPGALERGLLIKPNAGKYRHGSFEYEIPSGKVYHVSTSPGGPDPAQTGDLVRIAGQYNGLCKETFIFSNYRSRVNSIEDITHIESIEKIR